MTSLALTGPDVAAAKTDVLIIGAAKGPKGPQLAAGNAAVDKALGGRLAKTLADLGFVGDEDESVRIPTMGATGATSVVVVGLGDAKQVTAETLRRAAGTGVRAAAGTRRALTTLALSGTVAADEALRAVAEGSLLGAYDFTRFRNASLDGRKEPVQAVTVATADPKGKASANAAKRAETVAAAVALARDLVNTPPGDLHPADLADVARTEGAKAGCAVDVMDEKALRKGGYGGILGVGQGSANPPRLVRIAHTHAKATRTLALVGKGVTFDSGGISIKPAASMEWMKSDMAGAAAVVAALTAIARLNLPVNVTGWVPTAENMPSGSAIRPGDVLTMYGGKRVEILNTDAEGRLILADAIVRAGEESPDLIVDAATLTGAQLVALGNRTAGVMANDDDLRARIVDASGRAGEMMWPMPLPAELRKSIDSDVADITNTGDRYGGMLVGGVFLREFVKDGIPWAHLDVAGPAYNTLDAWGYTPKGGTGVPVRTFVQLAEDESAR
ncbi:MAG TPA: leucyl aminopeptidase [Mycobacteriales bacterium]|jgi:leucyl aminopeptidase|nr:leucyl aminopeptidase [Mycobacteriales bacterium]